MARSRASAARRELNVPRFLRLPVLAFFLREYKRYWPDFILRIMVKILWLRNAFAPVSVLLAFLFWFDWLAPRNGGELPTLSCVQLCAPAWIGLWSKPRNSPFS
jgi:hypothetical protein